MKLKLPPENRDEKTLEVVFGFFPFKIRTAVTVA